MPVVIPRFAEVGTLVAGGGTGDESVTGLAFNDLALVLLVWNPGASAEDTFNANFHIGFGAFDGTNQFSTYMEADDGDGLSPPGEGAISTAFVLNSKLGWGEAAAVSLDTAGFTINWSEAPVAGQIVYYMAFNADVFEAAVGTLTLPNGGGVSVSGLAFSPASILLNYALGNQFGIGFAARVGEPVLSGTHNMEAAAGAQFAFVTTSSGTSYSRLEGAYGDGSVMHVADSSQVAPDPEAYAVSGYAADGFSLTTQSTGGAGAVTCGYVAITPTLVGSSQMPKARNHVSNGVVPGGGPPASQTRDLRPDPDGYFHGDKLTPTCGVFVSPIFNLGVGDFGIAVGFVDDLLNQRSCWAGDVYLSSPSQSKSYSTAAAAVAFRFPDAIIYSEGEIISWNKFGFDIDWPTYLDSSGSPNGATDYYFFSLWGYAGRRVHLLPLTGGGYA